MMDCTSPAKNLQEYNITGQTVNDAQDAMIGWFNDWDDPRLAYAKQFAQIFREEYVFKHYEHLFLIPCVGINYGRSKFGLALLNLGESHYQYQDRSILRTE